jgi:uncharacterized delta-60 repeat protein
MPRVTSINQRQLTTISLGSLQLLNTGTGFDSLVETTVLQPDGKILVGGFFTQYNGVTQTRIVRLNSDGARDTGFSTGTLFNIAVRTIALQSDGKVLVGGEFTTYQGSTQTRIARLTSTGFLDTFTIGTGFDLYVSDIALQSNGTMESHRLVLRD